MVIKENLTELKSRRDKLYQTLDIETKKEDAKKLESITQKTDFWENPTKANQIFKKFFL